MLENDRGQGDAAGAGFGLEVGFAAAADAHAERDDPVAVFLTRRDV